MVIAIAEGPRDALCQWLAAWCSG